MIPFAICKHVLKRVIQWQNLSLSIQMTSIVMYQKHQATASIKHLTLEWRGKLTRKVCLANNYLCFHTHFTPSLHSIVGMLSICYNSIISLRNQKRKAQNRMIFGYMSSPPSSVRWASTMTLCRP